MNIIDCLLIQDILRVILFDFLCSILFQELFHIFTTGQETEHFELVNLQEKEHQVNVREVGKLKYGDEE